LRKERLPGPSWRRCRRLKVAEIGDFPNEAAALRDRTIGRLIPSSVRHSRHTLSLNNSDFLLLVQLGRQKLWKLQSPARRLLWTLASGALIPRLIIAGRGGSRQRSIGRC
jgi:hypothetical protein